MEEKIKIALEWWKSLDASVKQYLISKYFWVDLNDIPDKTIAMIYEAEKRI